jgi:hypothetical protein
MRRAAILALVTGGVLAVVPSAGARVLRVGTYKGMRGQFKSIQAAVDAAKPGDWILIGPGDYKEHSDRAPAGHGDTPAGVLITKPDLYLRGMNRNRVVVDGTKPGTAKCSSRRADQEFGPRHGKHHTPLGLNGLMVWKAGDVWIQNLTACNYLHGAGDTGNEIWWNGGHGSATGGIGGHGYVGSFLNATSTFFKNEETAAQYGIFSSNWTGGTWDQTYASNFSDSGYYIGACTQQCNQIVKHAHAQYSVLGYSGSNSGGTLIVENSEFDHNQDGFDTNSQNGDNPPPQNGECPGNKISPITHTHSCWVFMHNFVHDNNNPDVPATGTAAQGPVGTGMSVSGGRNDTVMENRFVNNGAWGVIFVPYPDSGNPCTGGTKNSPLLGNGSCLYDEWGDALLNNSFTHDGFFGNPTNGDFEQQSLEAHPTDCFSGNTDASGGLNPDSAALEQTHPSCNGSTAPSNLNIPFLDESLCDSQIKIPPFGCLPGDHYPRQTKVVMHPLPKGLKTMPNPCQGVPRNPWCPGRKHH